MYEVNAMSTLAVYSEFVQGTGREVALVVSSRPLESLARDALVKSFAALGYGSAACAWVVTEESSEVRATGGGAASSGAGAVTEAGGASAVTGGMGSSGTAGGGAGGANAGASEGEVGDGATNATGEAAVQLGAYDLMSIVEGLDPLVIVATDHRACGLLFRAYRCSGKAAAVDSALRIMGRTCIAFRDFESMMSSAEGKQKAWALLKKLPKLP